MAAAVWGILAGCSGDGPNRPEETPVNVVAQRVSLAPQETRIEAVGSARAERSVQLVSEEAGEVTAVRFSAGDFVRQGQPLVELDARAERLAVERAQVNVREARQLLDRYRRIEDTGALSESQIEAGEIALAAAQIELKQAQVALSRRTVRAPFAGHIGFTDLDRGARVTAATPIAQIDDRDVLFVDFAAPESVFGRLRPGQTLQVIPYADPERSISGRIRQIGAAISPQERTFTVRVVVQNADDRLRPGMSFRVGFEVEDRAFPAVPEAALVWGSEGAHLWRVREGRARRTPVKIVARRDGSALVEADLRAGDLIIAEGVQKVREGAPVRLVRPAEPSPVGARPAAPAKGAGDGG